MTAPIDRQGVGRGHRIARNGAMTFVGFLLPSIVAVVTVPIILSRLGSERFGLLSLVWLFLGYVGSFDLGLGRATTKLLAELNRDEDRSYGPRVVWTTLAVQVPAAFLIAILLAGCTPWLVESVLDVSPSLADDAAGALYLVALSVPIVQLSTSLRGALEALQRFDLVNAVRLPAGAATFLVPLVGAYLDSSVAAITLALLVTRLTVLLVHAAQCARELPGLLLGRLDKTLLPCLAHFSGWTTMSMVLQQAQLYLERFLIGAFLGLGILPFFAVPSDMLARLGLVPSSLASALLPEFSMRRGQPGHDLGPLMARALKYLLLLLFPILVAGLVLMEPVLGFWLGKPFAQSATPTAHVLLFTSFLNALGYVPITAVQAAGRPDWKAKLDGVEILVFLISILWLLPLFGILGVAIARLLVQVIDSVALFSALPHLVGVRFSDLYAAHCKEVALFGTALTVFTGIALLAARNSLVASLAMTVSLVVFAVLAPRIAFDQRDRDLLSAWINRIEPETQAR
jgi:O-antigen/teichoic acid export membrane protein